MNKLEKGLLVLGAMAWAAPARAADDTGSAVGGVVIIAGGIAAYVMFKKWRGGQVSKARAVYDQALAALAANPDDSRLRTAALEAGRKFYATTRGAPGSKDHVVTVYDETAINNDITARLGAKKAG